MSHLRSPIPSYRLHMPSGQAVCTIPLGDGRQRDLCFDPYNPPDSKREYERVIAEQRASRSSFPPPVVGGRQRGAASS